MSTSFVSLLARLDMTNDQNEIRRMIHEYGEFTSEDMILVLSPKYKLPTSPHPINADQQRRLDLIRARFSAMQDTPSTSVRYAPVKRPTKTASTKGIVFPVF